MIGLSTSNRNAKGNGMTLTNNVDDPQIGMQSTIILVKQMRVIWRDTFVIEDPADDFLGTSLARVRRMPSYVCDRFSNRRDQTAVLQIMERASRNVARTGYENVVRIQFNRFKIANLHPTLKRLSRPPDSLSEEQIVSAASSVEANDLWFSVLPLLLLHKSGTGIMQYHVSFNLREGYSPDEAIALVRMGISPQLLMLPPTWQRTFPKTETAETPEKKLLHGVDHLIPYDEDMALVVTGLRDISQHLIAARLKSNGQEKTRGNLRRLLRGRKANQKIQEVEEAVRLAHDITRPTGSTSVILAECDPMPTTNLKAYIREHAQTLRGIGAMDVYYEERAPWLIEQELLENLSTDTELGVYLLGNSELLLFNDLLPDLLPKIKKRLRVKEDHLAIIYEYMHYTVLLEWIYLQEAILRAYIQRLDKIAASGTPERKKMVDALQGALSDMVQYQENISPFANRVEFLERAGKSHNLDKLIDRFERKQELLLTYASEWHDYREASAAIFLNYLAGILAAAELTDILIPLFGIDIGEDPGIYVGISLSTIATVFIVLIALSRRRG